MIKKNKGFTLIELLVVIAIIGILAATVLASLFQARIKAKVAKVQSELSSTRGAAEIYYATNSNYGVTAAACNTAATAFADATSNMSGLIAAIATDLNASPTTFTNMDCNIAAAGAAWSIAVLLPGGTTAAGPYFCVDSTGASRGSTAAGAAYTTGLVNAAGPHAAAGASVCN